MLDSLEAFRIAIGSISSSKLRSALTTLGIVIGLAAVIDNVSLGTSFGESCQMVSLIGLIIAGFNMSDDKKRYHLPTMIETSRSRVKRFVYTLINN